MTLLLQRLITITNKQISCWFFFAKHFLIIFATPPLIFANPCLG